MDIGNCIKCKKVRKIKNIATGDIDFLCKKLLAPLTRNDVVCDYFKERKGTPFNIINDTQILTSVIMDDKSGVKKLKKLSAKLPKDSYEHKLTHSACINRDYLDLIVTLPKAKIQKLLNTATLPEPTYEVPDAYCY